MKNLKDSILEKLRVDDIIINNEFPIEGTMDDMIKFLEENGFVAADESHNYKGTADDMFDHNKSKCFYQTSNRFWFADTSKEKISKKNPIFFIAITEKIFSVYYCDSDEPYWGIDIVKNDKKAFLKELNKRFGWQ